MIDGFIVVLPAKFAHGRRPRSQVRRIGSSQSAGIRQKAWGGN